MIAFSEIVKLGNGHAGVSGKLFRIFFFSQMSDVYVSVSKLNHRYLSPAVSHLLHPHLWK